MKKIFIKSIPYIIGFILINLICLKTSNFFTQEEKYLNRLKSSISSKSELIFLGDSHSETIRHLDLDNRVGNLAFGADGIKEMYAKSLIATNFIPNVQYVFISTEPQIFNNTTSSNSSFLNPYLLEVDDPLNVYDKNKLDLLVERVPLFNDNYLKYYLNKVFSDIKNFGNEEKKEIWTDLSESQKKIIAAQTGKIDHNAILTNKNDTVIFKKIVDLYRSKNIKVIGIRFPVNNEYINQCNKDDLNRVDSFIKSLDLDYNLDYSKKIEDSALFADEDHLNLRGVVELAKLIYKDTGIKLSK